MSLVDLQSKLGHEFKSIELLQQSLVHRSYANEMRSGIVDNEKFEFLGDAVLDLVVGEKLFHLFPEVTEGGLSKKRASLVNEETLTEVALKLELQKYMLLGKGEVLSGGSIKPRLLSSCFEAVIGALFLDAGYETTAQILIGLMTEQLTSMPMEDFARDYKTRFQEIVQRDLKIAPSYAVVEQIGPSHEREFLVQVKIADEVIAEGKGRSKKAAEQMAAKIAIENNWSDFVNRRKLQEQKGDSNTEEKNS